jgi:hypothetical protein
MRKQDTVISKSTKTIPILVRVTPAQLKALDNWRRKEPDIPTRPEAVRRLLDKALSGAGSQNKP